MCHSSASNSANDMVNLDFFFNVSDYLTKTGGELLLPELNIVHLLVIVVGNLCCWQRRGECEDS